MSRLMFDSDVIDALPRDTMAATYSDLIPSLTALHQLRREFPFGIALIDRGLGDPTGMATILDVERGARVPAEAPGWYDHKKAEGLADLTVYVNRSNLAAVDAALGPDRHPYHWVATLDGTMHIPGFPAGRRPGLVQFAGETALGFHCDASVIWEAAWHPPVDGKVLDEMAFGIARLRQLFG